MFDPFKNYAAEPQNKSIDQELMNEFCDLFGPADGQPIHAEPTPTILEVAKRGTVSEFLTLKATGVEYDVDQCLDYASHGNNVEMIRHLVLVEQTKPTYYDCMTAIEWFSYEALDELLTLGADPHAENDALTYHAAAMNYAMLEILAKHGAKNYTPILNDFIKDDMKEVAIYLMDNGAEPDLLTLSLASRIKDLTILKYLLTEKGMVPPEQRFMDELSDSLSEAKQLLNKSFLQAKLKTKYKPTTQQQAMKI